MSLMDMVKGHLTQAVIGKLGGMLGESTEKTTAGVNAAVPTILDGIIRKASTNDGANWLGKELDSHDGGVLSNIGGMFEPSQSAGIADKGVGLLGSLMGDGMFGNIVGLISKVSGLGSGSSRSMLGILAPIVMGVLGKHRKSSGMDLGSLVGFLNEQKSSVSGALPAGLNQLYQGGAAASQTASHATTSTTQRTTQSATTSGGGGGGLGKLIPLLLIPLLAFLAWKFWPSGAADTIGDGVGAVGDGLTGAAGAVGDGVTGAAGAVGDGVGALGDAASGAFNFDLTKPQSVISGLPGMMDGAKETFGSITDVDSAKAALPKIEGLSTTFGNLGQGLGGMPEAAQGTIKKTVGGFIPTLQGMVDKVLAIPGVEAVLGPTIKGLLEKLAVFG